MRWHDASNIYLAIAHYTDLAASLLPPDHLVIKIGRTNNVARRAHKLRKRFTIVEAASVPSGDIARDIESRVLARTRHLVVPSALQKRLRLPHVSECRLVDLRAYNHVIDTLNEHWTTPRFVPLTGDDDER